MTVINLPLDNSPLQLSDEENVFWKQIIPMNKEIVYGTQKLTFDQNTLREIKSNYDAHLMDQIAFQLVDDENQHDTQEDILKERNWDPQRYRGDMIDSKIDADGFWGKFKLTEEGTALVKKNPKLGVSASIKPIWTDASGVSHKNVLRHVVGTLNPKIKGMSPWQRESNTLSLTDEANEEVFDLTTVEPDKTKDDNSVTLSREDYDKLQKQIADFNSGEELLDAILAEEDDDEVEPEPANLSDAPDPKFVALENKVAASEWRARRTELVNSGVPAAMLNLCDGIMSVSEGPVINLSDGGKEDPREVLLKVLEEAKGTVDLSDEVGHGKTPDERDAENKKANEYIDGFITEFNLGVF